MMGLTKYDKSAGTEGHKLATSTADYVSTNCDLIDKCVVKKDGRFRLFIETSGTAQALAFL